MSNLSDRQKHQLQFLDDIYEISCMYSTKTYIWGGLVMDIMEGIFLREHHDIDGFILNLMDVKERMDEQFILKGYFTEFIKGIDMYKIHYQGFHAAFNRLEIEKDTAMWRHIGDKGTLYFPVGWLKDNPVNFCDSPVFISGPEFEYAIKEKVSLLSPEWQIRDTDKQALEYYRDVIKKRNITPESILIHVWSDNPYWREKGYKEY